MGKKLIRLAVALAIYLALRYAVPYGGMALFPVALFVTYLHELGHAFFALVTGGTVHGIQINPNGSGYALINGGFGPLVYAGGYIGSAIFGNVILYISFEKRQLNSYLAGAIMVAMLLTGIFLFQSVITSFILFLFASVFMLLSYYLEKVLPYINTMLGCASLCYIFEDFARGPASDLAMFSRYFPFAPPFAWGLVWLAAALVLTFINLRYFILVKK
jgi:hypothetical protein